MYGVVGTSTEVTLLATEFLPPQVAFAAAHGMTDVAVVRAKTFGSTGDRRFQKKPGG